MKQINLKTKKILIILWSMTLLISLIGISFGYFSAISKSDPQIITTQSLNISLTMEGSTHINNINPTIWDNINLENNDNNNNIVKIPFRIYSSSKFNGEYTIRMITNITENELLNGGNATDIKYKVYKENEEVTSGNFNKGEFDEQIVNEIISQDNNLNDTYNLYIYIENKNEAQNKLQDIEFSIRLFGEANQTS